MRSKIIPKVIKLSSETESEESRGGDIRDDKVELNSVNRFVSKVMKLVPEVIRTVRACVF